MSTISVEPHEYCSESLPSRWFSSTMAFYQSIGSSESSPSHRTKMDWPIGGRPLVLGMGICLKKPAYSHVSARWMMGEKTSRKIPGDSVSPWKSPCMMGKDGVIHS